MTDTNDSLKPNSKIKDNSMKGKFGPVVSRKGFSQLPNILTQSPKLLHAGMKPLHITLLINLLSRWNGDTKYPFPSYSKIARDIGTTPKTAWKATLELEAMHILTIKRSKKEKEVQRKSNRYSFDKLLWKLEKIAERQTVLKSNAQVEEVIYSLFKERFGVDHLSTKLYKDKLWKKVEGGIRRKKS